MGGDSMVRGLTHLCNCNGSSDNQLRIFRQLYEKVEKPDVIGLKFLKHANSSGTDVGILILHYDTS
jgi:hypothetical protein